MGDAVNEIADEVQRRRDGEQGGGAGASIYVLIYGLQRYRILRKGEDDFSFGSSSEDKKPDPGKRVDHRFHFIQHAVDDDRELRERLVDGTVR